MKWMKWSIHFISTQQQTAAAVYLALIDHDLLIIYRCKEKVDGKKLKISNEQNLKAFLVNVICTFSAERSAQSKGVKCQARI